jgi:phage-related protein
MIGRPFKPVEWVGSALADLREFSDAAQYELGGELWRVQTGRAPVDFKPMPTIGAGVFEIRVHTGTEYRLVYIAKFEEAVYVLHTFEKRSRKTARRDVEVAQRRLAEVLRQRKKSTRQPRHS